MRIHSSLYWIIVRKLLGMNRTIIPWPTLSFLCDTPLVFVSRDRSSGWDVRIHSPNDRLWFVICVRARKSQARNLIPIEDVPFSCCRNEGGARAGDDKTLGLFLKHSQWPPKAFALPGLRANAASKPSLDIWDSGIISETLWWRRAWRGLENTRASEGKPTEANRLKWLNFFRWAMHFRC
jgi:hypothetical protein